MAEARIPVDLFNPGQVFACLGFLEVADILLGDAEGGFDWSNEASAQFVLTANGIRNPFEVVLEFISEATVFSVACAESKNSTEKWKVPTKFIQAGHHFPFPDPPSPATLPVIVRSNEAEIVVDHWGDATNRDSMKFWAGSGGYPGAALMRDALSLIRPLPAGAASDPFSVSAIQSSSFRLDWRRDYIPIDAGFSPNEHSEISMLGYPIVEILAVMGLSNARPKRIDKLNYRYAVIGPSTGTSLFSPALIRVALGCTALPFRKRMFRMHLGWPGQENQARCITNVTEEHQQ
jgi:CRISPR-associated protein Csb3